MMGGGAVLVAVAAAIGNLLQGWDNATIAGNHSHRRSLSLSLSVTRSSRYYMLQKKF
jgi:hypothetical protein